MLFTVCQDINLGIVFMVVTNYQNRLLFKLICKDLVQNDKTVSYWHVKAWQDLRKAVYWSKKWIWFILIIICCKCQQNY